MTELNFFTLVGSLVCGIVIGTGLAIITDRNSTPQRRFFGFVVLVVGLASLIPVLLNALMESHL